MGLDLDTLNGRASNQLKNLGARSPPVVPFSTESILLYVLIPGISVYSSLFFPSLTVLRVDMERTEEL
ncbi:uncharacterized protein YALI1_D16166g [Yarrowia lipolytica]|uniref:Uncharacterized protein n=1 Tax=Yarrowia lipolytica TaxID=4952 RepID=A0A1D8NED2_YARLL|nr:hypothetical protein YALI1_D16166g [Yarrowia lipolytica]